MYLLTEMIGEYWEIVDPIGGSIVDFEETAREIEQILSVGYEKICKAAADPAGDE